MTLPTRYLDSWTDEALREIEAGHPKGMTVQQIVDAITAQGGHLTEATFRKYVQLGLLPRSMRVGRKGKHRGSQGLYPATAVRQIVVMRHLMAQGFTIEEIQREFLFVRGEIDALTRQLERIYAVVDEALARREPDEFVLKALEDARVLGGELVSRLEAIEQRLSVRARMARAVV